MRTTRTSVLALLALGACVPAEDIAGSHTPELDLDTLQVDDYAPDRIIVGLPEGAPFEADLDGKPLGALRTFRSIHAGVFQVPDGRPALDVVRDLRATGRYAWVEPDLVRYASVTASDPYYDVQWNFDAINLESAWDYSTGRGAVVAVIDTGLSTAGRDTPMNIAAGWDWVGDDSDPSDENGHGTHVAGTIAQATNNAYGVAGIAYNATIMPLRVLNRSGSGYTSDVILALEWAADNGADVVNMSLGSSSPSDSEEVACDAARDAGLLLFAAAGNDGGTGIDYPAAYESVIAVGATNAADELAYYSDTGPELDLVAPGGDTTANLNGDAYVDGVLQETFSRRTWGLYFYQGTSMATPHAAGVAALLVAADATGTEALACMKESARDLGDAGRDDTYGYGLVDATAALERCGATAPVDADVDGYTTATDCYDSSANAYPGATAYYTEERGDGSFDYNCDGLETQRYTTSFSCRLSGRSCRATPGWTSGTPECGATGDWATSCTKVGSTCIASGATTQTQSCR
jgi:serine protease